MQQYIIKVNLIINARHDCSLTNKIRKIKLNLLKLTKISQFQITFELFKTFIKLDKYVGYIASILVCCYNLS